MGICTSTLCPKYFYDVFFSMEIPGSGFGGVMLTKKLGLTDGRVKKHHTPRNFWLRGGKIIPT